MSSVIKTKNQQIAELSLKCVRRINLLKNAKWKELDNSGERDLLPDKLEEFREFKNGKWWLENYSFDLFLKWFLNPEKNEKLKEIINCFAVKNDNERREILRFIREYIEEGKFEPKFDVNTEKFYEKIEDSYRRFKSIFKPDYTKEYSSHIKQLPSMIITNSLIPALAFYKSKGKDREQIFQDISEILEKLKFKPYLDWKNKNPNKDLLDFLLETDPQTLRLTTNEILNIATWLKRMAEIELKEVS